MSEENRRAVLAAAAAAIGELGYQRATTREICRRAGVSSGTFFHYFPSKLAVLRGILAEDLAEATTTWQQRLAAAERDPDGALDAWFGDVVAEADDPGIAAFAAAIAGAGDDPEVSNLLEGRSRLDLEGLTAVVGLGRSAASWHGTRAADRTAALLAIVADGIATRAIEDPALDVADIRGDLHEVVDAVVGRTGRSRPSA
ncbi:TetR/AcrR family transcriptional regulator [Serinibacter arcticus]|uniref:Transcriptional regulator, TetR family n=1 Tax=Serinibacter arcticus TaxID=1655435 RepID=A0A4Z1DXD0_9MICO|nr:TetR/AcrR family transcriptional regulator [Serinibacter arcticus]TGO04355.1 Transcriptional regulator, TetR family [Serinibacter arcticus]